MKKIFLLIGVLLFIKVDVFATDACDRLVPQEAYFVGKVTIGSNLRSYPCIGKSTIHGVSKVGDNYQVISKVDGYYQVELPDGNIYRIWEKAITRSYEQIEYSEPEPVKYEVEKTISNGYTLTSADKMLVNKFMYRVEKVVKQKGDSYKVTLVLKLQKIVDEGKYSDRLIAILDEIKDRVNLIELGILKEEVVVNSEGSTYEIDNIDISKVKSTWAKWFNEARDDLGKKPYSYDSTLEKTALEWSQLAVDRGSITHKRNTGDDYYDYNKITSWFKDRGVKCKNIYGVTNTENIGYGYFKCSDGDCTDELIDGIRSTFDFYMGEKYKDYKPHYQSIMNDYFTKMGLGIDMVNKGNGSYRYYLTVHYCTELID